ncbi:helix-turn-helix transcriptional regulator [Ancylobacter sp. MQZ15Z-1]|uniref:Helix-turn-helix transcriptional regulator n=1 Tax=Ancylobacter mangrovi TaxID=2972472 RepID=A0A9X2PGB2_9HYPH|nr:helix-turn-helix transcriptional regulator [Ancylobacter mangrovi]MCS0496864.1 helix-turn-helix transcriptional regulator [Ancylobacter mangrovi]
MEPFASNLRKRAEELGISNAEAARRAGLSERRYGNYISGRREPDLATLVRIATVLETSPNALLSFGAQVDVVGPKTKLLAAANVLTSADLETVSIMVEALASRRGAR